MVGLLRKQVSPTAFDEIQIVERQMEPTFVCTYADSYRNITLVLTGSECGLMFDFLGFDNPNAPFIWEGPCANSNGKL